MTDRLFINPIEGPLSFCFLRLTPTPPQLAVHMGGPVNYPFIVPHTPIPVPPFHHSSDPPLLLPPIRPFLPLPPSPNSSFCPPPSLLMHHSFFPGCFNIPLVSREGSREDVHGFLNQ
ncbi:hypothetical protein IRJ41_005647 [Triplophysa rosa]|uniref:Uncharacterized protein n=1 Tax=Triplophysa rosa TaxID=992332 RepID=A0A9W7WXX0_TRIRA|nr:hypothetical protein IRJ41_005647 [Triplophysa rosa]